MNIEDRLYKTAIKANDFTKNVARDDMIKKQSILLKDLKKNNKVLGIGIALTSSKIKDIMKVKLLENRGILLKGTSRKITNEEGGFFNFLRLLMAAGLPLVKIVLKSIAKSILLSFGVISSNVSNRCTY